jgi:tetratricopeptide (TPR) repeat protein
MRFPSFLASRVVAVVLVAVVLVPDDAGLARAGEGGTALSDAVSAFEAGEWKKAAEAAEHVPDDAEEAPKARYLLGEARLMLGDAAAAETAFRAVLEKRPSALPAKVGLGRALAAQEKNDDAEKVLKEAVAADAKDVAAQRALGELRVRQGAWKEADKVLEAALKLAPNDPLTLRALAESKLRQDDPKTALRLAQRLAKAAPKHPLGPFLKALALEKDGKDDEAIEAYEQALALDDAFLDAHKNLAILCHTRNPTYADEARTKKAMKHYERYFALGGADARLKAMYDQLSAVFGSAR